MGDDSNFLQIVKNFYKLQNSNWGQIFNVDIPAMRG